jgi:hypothetical protein
LHDTIQNDTREYIKGGKLLHTGRVIVMGLAVLAVPTLAQGLAPEPLPSGPITVIAPRPDAEKTAEAARTYADRVLPEPMYGQLARWRAPVCIKVSGIVPDYAPRVEGRIQAVARAADIPLAGADCRPNLLVIFTPDARKTVDVIVTRKPRTLRRMTEDEQRTLREAALPVRWWYTITPTDRNGIPAVPNSAALGSANSGVGGKSLLDIIPMNSETVLTDSYNGSLIDTNLIASVTGAVAVVDVPLATGVSLDALSEYLALVTLAPTRLPPTSPGVPSILDLFRASTETAPPETLSRWDSAFIAGLYESVGSRRASWQRGQIVEHLKTAMEP